MRIEMEIPEFLIREVVERWMQGCEFGREENAVLVECAIPVESWLRRQVVSGLGVRVAQGVVKRFC